MYEYKIRSRIKMIDKCMNVNRTPLSSHLLSLFFSSFVYVITIKLIITSAKEGILNIKENKLISGG